MQVRVLGEVAVADDDASPGIVVSSPSQRTVLAVLAASGGSVVRTDQLVDALWGDDPPASAGPTLRTYVSRLRRLLGDELVIVPTGYQLRCPVDVDQLEAAVVSATNATGPDRGDGRDQHGAVEVLEVLDAAMARWRGDPYCGLDAVTVLDRARARAGDLLLRAGELRARALLDRGYPADAALAAETVVGQDPWREQAWALLIEALAADHRTADALRAYQRASATLADAGLAPGPALRRAEAAALAASTAPSTDGVNPSRSAPAGADATRRVGDGSALPASPTSIIGRDQDLVAIAAHLDRSRIVTLLGPGGVGKTRLALETARARAGRHEWGARLVALDGVDDPADVATAVLDALDLVPDGASSVERLEAAGDLDLLVVLDNCEHVIEAAAAVAGALCRGGERIRVIATSRERLAVAGEQVWPVPPLAVAGAGRQLLIERALETRPDLDLTDVTLVDQVVEQLDGLPLAIEMAASQLASTSLTELATELTTHLAELASDQRDLPDRHRSLADLVRWTTDRLSDDDRALLAELSAFAGGFDAATVDAVTGRRGTSRALRRLVGCSLLTPVAHGSVTAFTMMGPIAACAADLLDDRGHADELAAAHADHFVRLARGADHDLRTEWEADAVARLDRALPDLRSAYRWASRNDRPLAFTLSGALFLYGQTQIRLEVLRWSSGLVLGDARLEHARADGPRLQAPIGEHVDAAVAAALADGAAPDHIAAVLGAAAHAAVITGDLALGRVLCDAGLAIADAPDGRWAPLEVAADIALYEGRLDDAIAVLDPFDPLPDDPHRAMQVLLGRTLPFAYRGDETAAAEELAQLMAVDVRSPSARAWVAYAEGDVVLDRDPPRALAALERAVTLADEVNDRYVGGVTRVSLCSLEARVGEPRAAARRFVEVIDHWRRQGDTTHLLTALRNLPVLLERLGQFAAVAALDATLEQIDAVPTWGEEAERYAAVRQRVVAALDPDEAAAARAAGAARSLDDAARAARDLLAG